MWIRFATGLSLLLTLFACACGSSMQQAGTDGNRDIAASLSLRVMDESFIAGSSAGSFGLTSRRTGNELLVSVRADAAEGLRALYYELDFDPGVLNLVEASPAPAFGSSGNIISMMQASAAGSLQAGQVLIHPERQAGFSGSGELAVLRFRLEPDSRLRNASKVNDKASAAPLELAWNNADKQLGWYYNNPADYDQNGEVNVADLTPLAVHFGASNIGGFPLQQVESVVDGDGNGLINLADITPIGVNFGNGGSGGYDVFEVVSGVSTQIGNVALSEALGDKSSERLRFFNSPASPQPGTGYFPRLDDGLGNLGFAPDPVFVPQVVDNPPFIVLSFLDRPQTGSGTELDPYILSDAIIGNTFHFQITDESQDVTGDAGVLLRASNPAATLSIDQLSGAVQFDPGLANTVFYMDGVSGGLDTQNRLYFNYVPEVVVPVFIMPDPADSDWASVTGDGLTLETAYVIVRPDFNLDGQTEFSFIANTKADGSGDPIDVGTLSWSSNPGFFVINGWTPPGTAKFHKTLTSGYVFALDGGNVESNHIYVAAKGLGG